VPGNAGFQNLRDRLIARIRLRIQNGEITERQVARQSGISQPHLHNALKGLRLLSFDMADVLMTHFRFSVLDLFDRQEIMDYLQRTHPAREQRLHPVPVLDGQLGTGLPPPRKGPHSEVHSVPYSQIAAATEPLVVSLAPDPEMEPVFRGGDIVLLDQSESARRFFQPGSYYVARGSGGLCIRRIHAAGSRIYLVTERRKDAPLSCERVDLAAKSILDVVIARVIWLDRRRRWEDQIA
jgi:AraC-like DNA-binding protein